MTAYCGENGGFFTSLNEWLSRTFATEQKVVFPYGNQYGWGIAHRLKQKLVCNIFAENNGFTVMVRLSDSSMIPSTASCIHIPGSTLTQSIPAVTAAGFIIELHVRKILYDIQKLLTVKCSLSAQRSMVKSNEVS